MRIASPLALAAALTLMTAPVWPAAQAATFGGVTGDMLAHFPNSGNDAAQGRYYDEFDTYYDWRTGVPIGIVPGLTASGGGGGGGGGGE